MRCDDLDPLPYWGEMPSLLSAWGRVDVHSVVAHYLLDNKLAGAYLEFGVGRGRSAVSALRAYRRAGVCDQFHLFDSFQGLPEPREIDGKSAQFQAGDYAFTREMVEGFLRDHEVWDSACTSLHEGYFEETVKKWVPQALASELSVVVVHVDVDFASSCLTVLSQIAELLQTGSVILFDDWNCYGASPRAGERLAVAKWLERNPHIKLSPWFPYGWHGQVFFCDVGEE